MTKLDDILSRYVADGDDTKDKLLGASFVVVNKDGIVHESSAGRVDLVPDAPAFTTKSFTWIASSTKIVTATAVMHVVERGLVKLDDDVRSVVPQLAQLQILKGFDDDGKPILEDNAEPITLRILLTHTVGLSYDIADPDIRRWSEAVGRTNTNLEFSLEGYTTPLKFPPGDGWFYGTGVDWAGQVLEKITGQRLSEYMEEHIFKPLGLEDTTFRRESLPQMELRRVQFSYRDTITGKLAIGSPNIPAEPPIDSGGAGLYTTAEENAKILQALLKAGTSGGILKKETVDEMFRPQLSDAVNAKMTFISTMIHDYMIPEFPAGLPIRHGITGVINAEDVPGKRRKGSMQWGGMANSHWFIDRETGIAATLIVNVQPMPDAAVIKLYDELERAVYADFV